MITIVNVRGKVSSGGITIKPEVLEDDGYADAPDIEALVNKPTIKPLSSFEDKDALEAYGKTFGIDLKKNFTLENMYSQLVEFVNK